MISLFKTKHIIKIAIVTYKKHNVVMQTKMPHQKELPSAEELTMNGPRVSSTASE